MAYISDTVIDTSPGGKCRHTAHASTQLFASIKALTELRRSTLSHNKPINMVAKLAIFSCLVAAAAAIAVPVGKIAYAQAPLQYAQAPQYAPAPVQYAPAPAQYASAPAQYASAPVHYAPAPVHYAPAPVQYAAPKLAYAEAEAPAQYDFEYSVHDSHTGDIKQHKESRSGDAVHGSYSLVQPDGVHRIVDYTSDKVNGFNANVRYEGNPTEAPHVAKVLAAPVHYAAPVAKVAYTPPPVHYAAAPIAKLSYSQAPVQYAQAPIQYAQAPIQYAQAPIQYAQAPVAKVAYDTNLGHVSFASPAASYHH